MPILPDEARLLFLASRPDAVCERTYLDALAASHPNWRAVGQLAEREKLLPILWSYMRDHAEVIPTEVREAFRRQAAVTEFRMALTESALRQTVEALAAKGIRVMLLKGAALATTVYGSFARRPMGDLDILVDSKEAGRAWQVMREAGWTLELEGGEEFYEHLNHLPGLLDPGGLQLVLEIHRSMLPLTGPFALDETELWREARSAQLGFTRVWVPSDRHQLLHLSVHFAWSNMFSGIGRTVRDVATILGTSPMAWAEFTELAVQTRARTCAFWTLMIARTLTGIQVPTEVLESLRPRQPRVMTRALERAYITSALFGACPSLRVARLLWGAGVQPEASGHGKARPWHTGELFASVFHLDKKLGIGGRLAGQLRAAERWWRFARAVVSPRRIL